MRWLMAVMCTLALSISAAESRPRHQMPRQGNTELTYCASDNSYRMTCGGQEKRTHDRSIASASTIPCRKSLDCGCSLARFFGISDPAKARRLWVARDWLREFPSAPGPVKGAVAVMSRGKGGHVGLVKGIDPNGNPIVESFKYYGSVGEAVYPKHRVLGYVWPS